MISSNVDLMKLGVTTDHKTVTHKMVTHKMVMNSPIHRSTSLEQISGATTMK